VASALVGGGWQVATRAGSLAALPPAGLALLRYGIPTLVLLPLLLKLTLRPRGVPARLLFFMLLGAGAPFGLVAISGTQFAPAAHMGVLMAGASPLIAALLAWLLWRRPPPRAQAIGLAVMTLGLVALGAGSIVQGGASSWRGDALFLLAAALWAGFTLSFRASGLTPWQAAAWLNTMSLLLLVPLLPWLDLGALWSAPASTLVAQAVWQGLVAGLLGLATFAIAIERLGAAQAAAFGGLAPVVSALGGWWWLDEPLGAGTLLAVGCTTLGVVLASGALGGAASSFSRRASATPDPDVAPGRRSRA